jgi:hypothetical protein
MAADDNRKNPLQRRGTTQTDRFLKALDPGHFKMDERSAADLILFAARYSRHLKYYNADNQADGDWSPFFTGDISAVLACLGSLPVSGFQTFGRRLQKYLTDEPARDETVLSHHFLLLFHLPVLLLREVGRHFPRLPRSHPLRETIQNILGQDAASPLANLVKYYRGALQLEEPIFPDEPLAAANYNISFDAADPRFQLPTMVSERLAEGVELSSLDLGTALLAGLAPPEWPEPGSYTWQDFYAAVQPDASPYGDSRRYHQIFDALNYNLLSQAQEGLFQALERIALAAAQHLEESLTGFDGHTPHYGLWLAFLRLFAFSQEHLNTLTRRHLEYYYREVLQLRLRDARPDKVHLLFELNKNAPERLLSAGNTFFKAGKDPKGQEILYRLDKDFVVSRAQVESLKSLYRPLLPWPGAGVFASEVADSKDGLGAPLPPDDPQWRPFGSAEASPQARLGFAVADKQLFLREGDRTITLVLNPGQTVRGKRDARDFLRRRETALSGLFKAHLTAEDGWLEVAPPKLRVSLSARQTLTFEISLDGEDPAIIPHDSDLHGEGYEVVEPVLKLEGAWAPGQTFSRTLAGLLQDFRFESMELRVAVQEVRNFTLQNEAGLLDTTKAFLPFGAAPAANTFLILGSRELFSKKLDAVKLHVKWEKTLTASGFFLRKDPSEYHVRLWHLKEGKWQEPSPSAEIGLFPGSGVMTLTGLSELSDTQTQAISDEPYGNTSNTGFLKLVLTQGFGHDRYINEKTKALINLAAPIRWSTSRRYNYDAQNIPREPYTPKITEIKLDYATKAAGPGRFYHIHPFGIKEEGRLSGRLLPELPYEGELYIGVKDLKPPQRLSLLFQTAEGTANPLKGRNTTLQWHYLRQDDWVKFEEQHLDDKTNCLTGSGIIGLAVPADADTGHAVMPAGLHWLRLSVAADADALNNLVSINAQAASASFFPLDNDMAILAEPRAPGSIAKLKVSDAAIKKVSQPYASFGGQPPETERHFFTRASERLRHKDRAATLWDYEHLVLERFPGIYKVKCINHTELRREAGDRLVDQEMRPGHVLLVTIPYLPKGQRAANPLRPYTDKKTLVAIEHFLASRHSPFVRLQVMNPKLEEIQVEFNVAFTPDIADLAFYKAELNQAIIRFLSPWAYDEGAEISFGGRWYKSAIINFVEEQAYVAYVTDFKMYHKADITQADSQWRRVDEEMIEATASRSILVSHAQHKITEIMTSP